MGDTNCPSLSLCSHSTVPREVPSGSGSLYLSDVLLQQLPLREQRIHPPTDSQTVSMAADDPILGDSPINEVHERKSEAYIGDGTPQPVKNHQEEVGGASVSSRKRVESCSALLSTVGKEQSNRVSDSPEASDRAAIQNPRSHGASGIRVSGCHASALLLTALFQVSQTASSNGGKSYS